jgi:hypothetical protein
MARKHRMVRPNTDSDESRSDSRATPSHMRVDSESDLGPATVTETAGDSDHDSRQSDSRPRLRS